LKKSEFINWSIEAAIKIALLCIIIWISYLIFRPFLVLILWGIIVAVAVYPIHKKLLPLVGGKSGISASILSLVMLAVIIVPTIFFIISLVDNIQMLASSFDSDTYAIPPPPDNVRDWPFIGKPVYDLWAMSSENIEQLLTTYSDQATQLGEWLLSSITSIVITLFVFIGSIIVSAIFLSNTQKSSHAALKVFNRLIGAERGPQMLNNTAATIRSVVQGVLGVAIIQATLVGAGFFVADIPAASILTLIVLFLAIVQLPPSLVVIPVIIYVFSVSSTGFAVGFAIWSMLAGISDTFLKPLMLGRGLAIPMLVILIGAIGGMILFGIIGLFLGSVILALAYQLFQGWVAIDTQGDSIIPKDTQNL
jgi:predicted PurR-regulated permease PerM